MALIVIVTLIGVVKSRVGNVPGIDGTEKLKYSGVVLKSFIWTRSILSMSSTVEPLDVRAYAPFSSTFRLSVRSISLERVNVSVVPMGAAMLPPTVMSVLIFERSKSLSHEIIKPASPTQATTAALPRFKVCRKIIIISFD